MNPKNLTPYPRCLPIPDKELLKTLWEGWGVWGVWGVRILSTVLKKMYFSIHFSLEKASPRLMHDLSILSSFMLRKMFIKHSFRTKEWGFQSLSPMRREVWREIFIS